MLFRYKWKNFWQRSEPAGCYTQKSISNFSQVYLRVGLCLQSTFIEFNLVSYNVEMASFVQFLSCLVVCFLLVLKIKDFFLRWLEKEWNEETFNTSRNFLKSCFYTLSHPFPHLKTVLLLLDFMMQIFKRYRHTCTPKNV